MFISHADFNLPAIASEYIGKHIYMWIYQNGAVNFDGIIRLPGRLINIVLYQAFDNVTASYFYLIISYLIVGISFWLFLKYFLNSKSRFANIVATLIYTFNPVFLSNTSKVGLIAAIGLLPLCLILIKRFIETKHLTNLFWLILCLNYSLVHPYTFTVNLIFVLLYLAYKLFHKRSELFKYLPKLTFAAVIAVLLHMYIALPIVSIGSISKDVLSQNVAQEPVDYSELIEISNAGGTVNTLRLSKEVFLEYEYFTPNTEIFYTVSVLALYLVAYGGFILLKDKISKWDKKAFYTSSAVMLSLLFLSSGHALASKIILILIGLPGGWIFRSPLKWQMYVPLFLIVMIVILAKYYKSSIRYVLFTIVLILGTIQSGYLLYDVNQKLITPRTIQTFRDLEIIPDGSRILYLSGSGCISYLNSNFDKLNELNQLFVSRYWQVKKANQTIVDTINLTDYDYILVCKESGNPLDTKYTNLTAYKEIDSGNFTLYKNTSESQRAESIEELYYIENPQSLNIKEEFVNRLSSEEFNFTTDPSLNYTKELIHILEEFDPRRIENNTLSTEINLSKTDDYLLYSEYKKAYITKSGNVIEISDDPSTSLITTDQFQPATIESSDNTLRVNIKSNSINQLVNLIDNYSFDDGLWKKDVEDCYNFDKNPNIGMRLVNIANQNALELEATRHIACTSTTFDVTPGKDLYLSFKFQSPQNNTARMSIRFNDETITESSFTGRHKQAGNEWLTVNGTIRVPEDATSATITLYGYPNGQQNKAITRYDDIFAFEIPELLKGLFLISDTSTNLSEIEVQYQDIDPTYQKISIKNAEGNILLKINDTYDSKWLLGFNQYEQSSSISKVVLNNFTRGWYIDINKLCENNVNCSLNPDNTYNINLIQSYLPQKYFVDGLLISGITFVALIISHVFVSTFNKIKKTNSIR